MKPAHAPARAAALVLLTATVLVLSPGCFKKKTYTPPPPPGTIDLNKVTAAGASDAALAAIRICRLFDIRYRGNQQTRVLTLNQSLILDDNGIDVRITPEEFKGIINLVTANDAKEITTSTRLARNYNYKDTFGLAQRHAYLFDSPDGATQLRIIVTKRLDGESDG